MIRYFKFFLNFKALRIIVYQHILFKKYKNFLSLKLSQKSIVIDLGANVGDIASCIQDLYNCKIYCYEPNIYAFEILKTRFKSNKKVFFFNKAVGIKNEKKYLYLHKLSYKNPVKYSTGSSLLLQKKNIDKKNFKIIETVKIQDIINQFKYINLLKIDVEGFEYEILPVIIKNKNRIGKVICELHGDPTTNKNIFLKNKFLKFKKILDNLDPEKKWLLYHH